LPKVHVHPTSSVVSGFPKRISVGVKNEAVAAAGHLAGQALVTWKSLIDDSVF
jgi:hypothetical protein